jgi:methylthioribose-1-phosphate isomerase
LDKEKIPFTLICDNTAAVLMQKKQIQRFFVGADRIAINGDFANKIGTYTMALLASFHQIPFYVAAPYTTIDPYCQNGEEIEIEQRNPNEVLGFKNKDCSIKWCPENTQVYNPSFDVTPGGLVTQFIFDKGRVAPAEIRTIF